MKRRAGDIVFALFVLVGLILLGASFFYRVVQTPWGIVLLEKPHPAFGGSYIDTRHWGAKEFMQHWELSQQLMEYGLKRLPDNQNGRRERG